MRRAPPHSKKDSPPLIFDDPGSEGLDDLTTDTDLGHEFSGWRGVGGTGGGWDGLGSVACEEAAPREHSKQVNKERGKQSKLKKLKTKYRHQEDSERQVVLQVSAVRVACFELTSFCRFWGREEAKATANKCGFLKKRQIKERAKQPLLLQKQGFLSPSLFPRNLSSSFE